MSARVSQQNYNRSPFDRFGEASSKVTGQGAFFTACVGILLLWLVSFFFISNKNTWQLIINTITTIITFLLVALLQNSQRRNEIVMQTKLNAVADALADLMEHEAEGHTEGLEEDMEDLRAAVGLEERA